jgi:hypothetical protein
MEAAHRAKGYADKAFEIPSNMVKVTSAWTQVCWQPEKMRA